MSTVACSRSNTRELEFDLTIFGHFRYCALCNVISSQDVAIDALISRTHGHHTPSGPLFESYFYPPKTAGIKIINEKRNSLCI